MAYVPDAAVQRGGEIGYAAFYLYACYCMHRSKRSGLAYPSQETVHNETGIAYAHISTLKRKLEEAGWIRIYGREILPLMGFDLSAWPEKRPERLSRNERKVSRNESRAGVATAEIVSLNERKVSRNESPLSRNESKVSLNESPYKEILTSPLTSPINQPINQNSAVTPPGALPPGAVVPTGVAIAPAAMWAGFYKRYKAKYNLPYRKVDGDNKQLVQLRAHYGGFLTDGVWDEACDNYIASPLSEHRMRDLCARFDIFARSSLNQYKVPVIDAKPDASRNSAEEKSERRRAAVNAFINKSQREVAG